MGANQEFLHRISVRPEVLGGEPIIRDLRIFVELVLSLLAQGVAAENLLDDYPDLERDDILACGAYAHAVVARRGGPAPNRPRTRSSRASPSKAQSAFAAARRV